MQRQAGIDAGNVNVEIAEVGQTTLDLGKNTLKMNELLDILYFVSFLII